MTKKLLLTVTLIILTSACRTSVDVRGGNNTPSVAINVRDNRNRTIVRAYSPPAYRMPQGYVLMHNLMMMFLLR